MIYFNKSIVSVCGAQIVKKQHYPLIWRKLSINYHLRVIISTSYKDYLILAVNSNYLMAISELTHLLTAIGNETMSILSRRNLLRGRWQQGEPAVRPPWIISESVFINGCTRCNACIDACETGVMVSGAGGYPELDFSRAECSFCGRCAQVCQAALFDKEQPVPWRYKADIGASCLTNRNVECRVCLESCEISAIKFKLKAGRVAQPLLNTEVCNGCGACVSSCPVKAISVGEQTLSGE
jgi:ferredoxin-type protein NapF